MLPEVLDNWDESCIQQSRLDASEPQKSVNLRPPWPLPVLLCLRWMASFLKWREQLPEGDKEKFAAMQFPIPPFHLYAHR